MLGFPVSSPAQELEPRRWTYLPIDSRILTLGVGRSDLSILFDPVLQIEDGQQDLWSAFGIYSHSFAFMGRSSRVDLVLPYQRSRWSGLLQGEPASRRQTGLNQPTLRWSVLLNGAPPLTGRAFIDYLRDNPVRTRVGAAVAVTPPIGRYDPDRLLNVGQNRWIVRPELGLLHRRGRWSYELTGSVLLFGDNDEQFPGDARLEQDPILLTQAHLAHIFSTRWWASAGVGYQWGGEAEINGVPRDDPKRSLFWGASISHAFSSRVAAKFTLAGGDTRVDNGYDATHYALSFTFRLR